MNRFASFLALSLATSAVLLAQPVPVASPNVNMVSGRTWPDGDPFLQRQNEGSLAVSSRNPLHLLAGANDYRSVDLSQVITDERGDAWLGLFKSFDGGASWKSTLLPGCKYPVAQCQGSPLAALRYDAGADPTVRAGSNGMFYFTGLALDRAPGGRSAIFVARFIDDNNQRNYADDPIRYLSTTVVDTGISGQFLDKPWLAVDIPRPGGPLCTIPAAPNAGSQSFVGGNVYLVYSRFTGSDGAAKIYASRSTDCGVTWSKPLKISEGTAVAQGAAAVVDPSNGNLWVTWRQFQIAGTTQPDAIMVVRSADFGQTFSKSSTVALINPFDQPTASQQIRTNSYPALSVDHTGRAYIAWAGRNADGDARIQISTSTDAHTWSLPQLVDNAPPQFPSGYVLSGRGHQFMPALAIAGGRLAVLYYSQFETHTEGELRCLTPQCLAIAPALRSTALFSEIRNAMGNLPAGLAAVFTFLFGDVPAPPLVRRHTLDLRVAMANVGPVLAFRSERVSQYQYGSPSGAAVSKPIKQLRSNVPNLPLFVNGSRPFLGDYLEIVSQAIRPGATPGTWEFTTAPSPEAPTFHAVWTDNRDVRPPADGDWTHYTPPYVLNGGQTAATPNAACLGGQAGMRNQNIYTSRINEGLMVAAPENSRGLSNIINRVFAVTAYNSTSQARSYRLTIVAPPGVAASFTPTGTTAVLDVRIAARSTASRTVFSKSATDPKASFKVTVQEITAPGGTVLTGGQQASVTMNPDLTNPDLTNPDLTNPDLTNPDLTNPDLTNPDLTNPDLTNPDLTNPDLTNPDLTNPDLTNPDLTNPDLTNLGVPNPDLTNPDLTNPDLTNPDLTNTTIQNGAITDVTWKITNNGSSIAVYNIKTLLGSQLPSGFLTQLLLYKVYTVPVVRACDVKLESQRILVANIPNPVLRSTPDLTNPDLTNPDLTNPDLTNPTMALAPGESGYITLRIVDPDRTSGPSLCTATNTTNCFDPRVAVTPLVVSQTPPPPGVTTPPTAFFIVDATVPTANTGVFYSKTFTGFGGTTPYTWAVSTGTLPPGLTLSASGVLSGVPTLAGTYTFTIRATDSSAPQQADQKAYTLAVTVPPNYTWSYAGGGSALGLQNATLPSLPGYPPIKARLLNNGVPVQGVTVQLAFTNNPGGASLGGASSAITDALGYASFPTVTITRGGYSYRLAPSAPSLGLPALDANAVFTNDVVGFGDGPAVRARAGHTATLLASGKVLLAGGFNGSAVPGSAIATSDIVDPGTYDHTGGLGSSVAASVTPGPDLAGGVRGFHAAVLLPDGRVLIAGGTNALTALATAEVYIPPIGAAAAFVATGSMNTPRSKLTATLLPNGKVLIAGGENGGVPTATMELYDPATGSFSLLGATMSAPRSGHTAVLMPNGKVFLAGGGGANADIFDPVSNTISASVPMVTNSFDPIVAVLGDGRLWVGGGSATLNGSPTNLAQIFDPGTNTFTAPAASAGLPNGTATVLANGKLLFSGGRPGLPASMTAAGTWAGLAPLTDQPDSFGFVTPRAVSLSMPRGYHTATALRDGRVLVAGGVSGSASPPSGTTELFYPVEPRFSSNGFEQRNPAVTLPVPRRNHSMTLLPTGKVLIAGGCDATDTPNAPALLLYDPVTAVHTPIAGGTPRAFHTATLLPDGRVLVAGGGDCTGSGGFVSTDDLFDPFSGAVTSVPGTQRTQHTATLLGNGQVLLTGGLRPAIPNAANAQLFDYATSSYSLVASLPGVSRSQHVAVRMANGRVMIAGGNNGTVALNQSVEIFDPVTGLFSFGPPMNAPRYSHAGVALPNGKVLMSGGYGGELSAEVYDPATLSWGPLMTHSSRRAGHNAVVTGTGTVIITAGYGSDLSADANLYDPYLNVMFYNPANQTQTYPRTAGAAILAPDGRVYVTGGWLGTATTASVKREYYVP